MVKFLDLDACSHHNKTAFLTDNKIKRDEPPANEFEEQQRMVANDSPMFRNIIM